MKQWNIISSVAAVFALILSGMIYYSGSLDRRIEDKFNDPKFIKEVADEVRLPFVIFDDKESISVDTGAMKYIDKIKIKREKKALSEIIISPKQYLAVPPILESIDDKDIGFEAAKRGDRFDIIYKTIDFSSQWVSEIDSKSEPQHRFRVQMVVLPEQ